MRLIDVTQRGLAVILLAAAVLIAIEYPAPVAFMRLGVLGIAWLLIWGRIRRSNVISIRPAVSDRQLLVGLFLLALVVRLAWVVVAGVRPVSDYAAFDVMTRAIVEGGAWFTPDRPSGAALLFAPLYRLFGYAPLPVELALAVTGAVQAPLLYRLGRWCLPEQPAAAALAGLILAVYPTHIIYSSLLGPELPFTALVLAAGLLVSASSCARWQAAGAGAALGLAQYLRPQAMLLLAALLLAVIVRGGDRPLSACAAVVAVYLLVTAPFMLSWLGRTGRPAYAPAPYQAGMTLLMGTYADGWNEPAHQQIVQRVETQLPDGWSGDRVDYARRYDVEAKAEARRRFSAEPARQTIQRFTRNLPRLWGREPSFRSAISDDARVPPSLASGLYLLADLIRLPVLAAAAVNLWQSRRPVLGTPLTSFVLAGAALTTVLHLIVESQPRYSFVFLPFLILLAARQLAGNHTPAERTAPVPSGVRLPVSR